MIIKRSVCDTAPKPVVSESVARSDFTPVKVGAFRIRVVISIFGASSEAPQTKLELPLELVIVYGVDERITARVAHGEGVESKPEDVYILVFVDRGYKSCEKVVSL